jgi:hypothetical protein
MLLPKGWTHQAGQRALERGSPCKIEFVVADFAASICYFCSGTRITPEKGMALSISPHILAKRIVIALLTVLALVYCIDFVFLRVRMLHPKPADPFESLTASRVFAIPEKNGKTAYEVDAQNPQQTVTCVHSLFPHSGFSPCWYVKPRINQPVPM